MTRECEYLVIGAGITGLAIGRELCRRGAGDVLILDKENSLGCHASGRNSGVLHAGVYYQPESSKAQFCVAGNRLMRDYCRSHDIPLVTSGKAIVVSDSGQAERLRELKRRADLNGAQARLIDTQELSEIEPCAYTYEQALYCPDVAVVNPAEVLTHLAWDLNESPNAQVALGVAYRGLVDKDIAMTSRGPVMFSKLINAAGAYADQVAQDFGAANDYRILPFKGTYMRLSAEKSPKIRGNIYPVPNLATPFLGVHLTRNPEGQVHAGPTAIPAFGRSNHRRFQGIGVDALGILRRDAILLFQNNEFRRQAIREPRKYLLKYFYEETKQLVPSLKASDLCKSNKVGIRPQLVHWPSKTLVKDFCVTGDKRAVHILNAVSPGLTASLSFARYIADLINDENNSSANGSS